MNKEELLKEIMKLPKVETNNPISTMTSINIDDLMSAIDRLNKVPDYNDLLKENQELKKQLEEYKKKLMRITKMEIKQIDEATFVGIDYFQDKCIVLKAQQKEFIKYLEDEKDRLARICNNLGENKFDEADDILQKYKEIIGDDKEWIEK